MGNPILSDMYFAFISADMPVYAYLFYIFHTGSGKVWCV